MSMEAEIVWNIIPEFTARANAVADGVKRDSQGLERFRGDAVTLVDEAQQDVLGPDVIVVEQPGFFLCKDDYPASSVRESLKHFATLLRYDVIRCYVRTSGLWGVFARGGITPTCADMEEGTGADTEKAGPGL